MGTPGSAQQRECNLFRLLPCQNNAKGAKVLGVSTAVVSHWKTIYQHATPDSLKAKPHPGGKPRLNPARGDKLQYLHLLLKGPHAHGYPTNLLTQERISGLI
jgi:hypothetical protein